MSWDKEYYREIKKFMDYEVSHKHFLCTIDCPIEYVKTFLPLISMSIEKEDYEAAQATKDAIMQFLNKFLKDGNKIKKSDTLKLPAYVEIEAHGIVCLGDPNDKTGMASGGAFLF